MMLLSRCGLNDSCASSLVGVGGLHADKKEIKNTATLKHTQVV
jgi:hypothetical protein